ncbi:MAG: hypothetical protein NZ561_02200 [Phycisphaerae bacterium]|nr:hypothetical protein [Phycisphaerae bacterium]MDW8261699.1 hypothetical protein [Phycisphaerales bacterium]
MSQARVEDIQYLKDFRLALQKFQEAAAVALTDAESDLIRTMLWLETEQASYWKTAVRKRAEALSQAEERLRAKKIFTDATGSRPSTVDEEKAVRIARQRLEQAEQKVAAVARWRRQLEKIAHDYKGNVQRFATSVQTMLPAAIARLEAMTRQLEQYIGLQPREVTSTAEKTFPEVDRALQNLPSMRRSADDESGQDSALSSQEPSRACEQSPPESTRNPHGSV